MGREAPFPAAARRSFTALYDDLLQADLRAACSDLDVPVFIAAGRHDRLASHGMACAWLGHLPVRDRRWQWFDRSAHFPHWEEPAEFQRFLLDAVAPFIG